MYLVIAIIQQHTMNHQQYAGVTHLDDAVVNGRFDDKLVPFIDFDWLCFARCRSGCSIGGGRLMITEDKKAL